MPKQKKKNFCKKLSRVRLWVCDHQDNKESYYSFLADDKKGYEYVINAMKERILKGIYRSRFKVAIFYNNTTDTELETVSSQKFARNFNKSKVKLLLYDRANTAHTYFSNPIEDTQEIEYIVGSMHERYVKGFGFNAAIFYEVATGAQIAKFSAYGRQAV